MNNLYNMALEVKNRPKGIDCYTPPPPPNWMEVSDWIATGAWINLIKFVRQYTNGGLKDSKDLIEQARSLGNLGPTLSPIFEAWGITTLHTTRAVEVTPAPTLVPEEQEIADAVMCALTNWKTLGFQSAASAVTAVVKNF